MLKQGCWRSEDIGESMYAGRCITNQTSHFSSDSLQNGSDHRLLFVWHLQVLLVSSAVYLFIVVLFIAVSARVYSGRSSLVNTAEQRLWPAYGLTWHMSSGSIFHDYVKHKCLSPWSACSCNIQSSFILRWDNMVVRRNIALACYLGSGVCLLLFMLTSLIRFEGFWQWRRL